MVASPPGTPGGPATAHAGRTHGSCARHKGPRLTPAVFSRCCQGATMQPQPNHVEAEASGGHLALHACRPMARRTFCLVAAAPFYTHTPGALATRHHDCFTPGSDRPPSRCWAAAGGSIAVDPLLTRAGSRRAGSPQPAAAGDAAPWPSALALHFRRRRRQHPRHRIHPRSVPRWSRPGLHVGSCSLHGGWYVGSPAARPCPLVPRRLCSLGGTA